MTKTATYVYCVVSDAKRPRLTRVPAGLPGAGRVRLIDLEPGAGQSGRQASSLYLVVADVPLARYGEAAIRRGLSNLDWVSRAAVAHEAVVESFIDATAVLPMKLFTIFNTDERAVKHVLADRPRLEALVKRLANHYEWGVRVVLDRQRAAEAIAPARKRAAAFAPKLAGFERERRRAGTGLAYLSRKKAQREASVELAARAREAVAALYDRLAARSRIARRRSASELPPQGGPLLLDAAFLVPRARSRTFRSLAAREARALSRHGYGLALTGPWPPYTFVQD